MRTSIRRSGPASQSLSGRFLAARRALALGAPLMIAVLGVARTARATDPFAPFAPLAPLAPFAPFAPFASAGSLSALLDTVDAAGLRADVHFIASDELAGRDTPSLGQRVAARFLRSRLERLGWLPGAQDGYLHTYELDLRQLDAEASRIVLEGEGGKAVLAIGRDYFLRSSFDLAQLDLSAEVVFVGAGGEQDFASPEIAGRWALALEEDLNARTVRDLARDAGALGVLVAPGPGYAGDDYAERYASSMKRLFEARASYPRPEAGGDAGDARTDTGDGGRERRRVFPMACLTRAAAQRLFEVAGVPDAEHVASGESLAVRVHETRAIGGGGKVEVENVVGFWPGSDPDLAHEAIVISAHYDHVGTKGGEVYNGADDNGTGTCGLLAMAEALARNGPLRRSVALIWVSGEEKGLWGSQAWVEEAWLPDGAKPICDINLDMIGRNDPASLLVTPTEARPKDYNGLVRLIERLAPLEGFTELGSADDYYRRSDHANFAKLGIPVTFLFAGVHEDYHQPTDTPDKIDYDKVRRVVRLVLRLLDELQVDELDL